MGQEDAVKDTTKIRRLTGKTSRAKAERIEKEREKIEGQKRAAEDASKSERSQAIVTDPGSQYPSRIGDNADGITASVAMTDGRDPVQAKAVNPGSNICEAKESKSAEPFKRKRLGKKTKMGKGPSR